MTPQEALTKIVANEKQSLLTEDRFWEALELLSRQDAVLHASLQKGSYTTDLPDAKKPSLPITS